MEAEKKENYNFKSDGNHCRICLSDESVVEDPLVNPCDCSGSSGLTHISCLRKWFANKIVRYKTFLSYSFNLNIMKCEICKSQIKGNT